MNAWTLLPLFLAACIPAGLAGVLFKPGAWYAGLAKPRWTPPNRLFPIVWAVLYLTMSLAAARIAVLPGTGVALGLWAVQIAFNTLWSGVFFGLRRMFVGGLVLGGLWLAVAATTAAFAAHDLWAALLMTPYLVWATLALALNWTVWAMNRATPAAIT